MPSITATRTRFALLYRLLFRIVIKGEHDVLDFASDRDVAMLRAMTQAVRHEEHAMHAFVRFRRIEIDGSERFVAWYEPDHPILRLGAPFFARRFASMTWSILTPAESAFHHAGELRYGPGARREDAPSDDALEALFRSYYGAIFNPARIDLQTMQGHMPQKRWAHLPETREVAELVRSAAPRVLGMRRASTSASLDYLPEERSLDALARALPRCRACPLFERATQAVFGEGPSRPELVLIGEQPGDEEDLAGRPFVGPAGRVLDDILREVGIDREITYLTNAVKHFKFEPRGIRRIHSKPIPDEIRACHGWLSAELDALAPRLIVCLGATAAQSFTGRKPSVTRERGTVRHDERGRPWLLTYHPSAVLRAPDPVASDKVRRALFDDLTTARRSLLPIAGD